MASNSLGTPTGFFGPGASFNHSPLFNTVYHIRTSCGIFACLRCFLLELQSCFSCFEETNFAIVNAGSIEDFSIFFASFLVCFSLRFSRRSRFVINNMKAGDPKAHIIPPWCGHILSNNKLPLFFAIFGSLFSHTPGEMTRNEKWLFL